MRDVRNETSDLHDPVGGDNSWSLGCRVYARTLARLREEALALKWLRILPEAQALRFTFAIGNTPIKFYKGAADDVPTRSLVQSYSELRQMRLALAFENAPADLMVRFAVETDTFGKTASITLVEVDDEGTARQLYQIPMRSSNVITLQSKPISIARPTVRLKKEEEEKKVAEGGDNSDREK
jgi:hypothetical protein